MISDNTHINCNCNVYYVLKPICCLFIHIHIPYKVNLLKRKTNHWNGNTMTLFFISGCIVYYKALLEILLILLSE